MAALLQVINGNSLHHPGSTASVTSELVSEQSAVGITAWKGRCSGLGAPPGETAGLAWPGS